MQRRLTLALPLALAFALPACDSGGDAPKKDAAADKKAKEDAEYEANLKKRAEEREAKAAAETKKEEELVAKIEEVTAIPEGTKIPKKTADACAQVVEAQKAFMKKYHADIDDAALTTQLGMIGKQCNEMAQPKVAMCQKFALEATTEDLSPKINEYLPVCLKKYGTAGEGKAPKVPPKSK